MRIQQAKETRQSPVGTKVQWPGVLVFDKFLEGIAIVISEYAQIRIHSDITSALEIAKSGANLVSDRKFVFFSKPGMCLGGFLWPLLAAGPSYYMPPLHLLWNSSACSPFFKAYWPGHSRATEKSSACGLSMDPAVACIRSPGRNSWFLPRSPGHGPCQGVRLTRPPAEIASRVSRGSTEHQAARQLASSLSGTSGQAKRDRTALINSITTGA